MVPFVLLFLSAFGVVSVWCSTMDALYTIRSQLTDVQDMLASLRLEVLGSRLEILESLIDLKSDVQ
jgi:hypothetical protein